MVKDLLLFTPLLSGRLGLSSQTKAVMPTAFPILLALTLSLQQTVLHACTFSSRGSFAQQLHSSKCFPMHYLLQASAHRSMRVTLKHVWGLVQSPPAARQRKALSSMSQERGKRGQETFPLQWSFIPQVQALTVTPDLPQAFRKTTSSFAYN